MCNQATPMNSSTYGGTGTLELFLVHVDFLLFEYPDAQQEATYKELVERLRQQFGT